jgi:hypothetical protein
MITPNTTNNYATFFIKKYLVFNRISLVFHSQRFDSTNFPNFIIGEIVDFNDVFINSKRIPKIKNII